MQTVKAGDALPLLCLDHVTQVVLPVGCAGARLLNAADHGRLRAERLYGEPGPP